MKQVRRKDSKNRVLEKGESQREDGTYMYRWTDLSKRRQTIYATTLNELREKESQISNSEDSFGVLWSKGKMTVRELVELHRKLKKVKITTQQKYKYYDKLMDEIGLSDIPIREIRTSVAKAYMIKLSDYGYSYGTVQNFKASLSPAFQMAVEDDYITKNPFLFQLHHIIDDDRKQRRSMSVEEEQTYLDFIKNHGWYKHTYADIFTLLKTGLRVSELYGLTVKDLDFKNNRIHVNKQLHYIEGKYMIMSPKSKAGTRVLAMTPEVRKVLLDQMTKPRPTVTQMVDGHTGFVFVNHNGNLKHRKNLQVTMMNIRDDLAKMGKTNFSDVSPHVLRHTFCSRMIENGMDVKTLQIIMGHSDIGTTLNVYTHLEPEDAAKTMEKVLSTCASNA